MSQLKELRRVPLGVHQARGLAPTEADYLRSDRYRSDVDACETDPRRLAALTCGLLENVALDPRHGNHVEDFVLGLDSPTEDLWVWCQLHRLTNFVGFFTMPRGLAETAKLIEAVQSNLDSAMFRAAVAYRAFLQDIQPGRYREMGRPAGEGGRGGSRASAG